MDRRLQWIRGAAAWSFLAVALLVALKCVYFNNQIGLQDGKHYKGLYTLVTLTLVAATTGKLLWPRRLPGLALGFSLATSVLILLDLMYYRFSGNLIAVSLIPQLSGASYLNNSAATLLRLSDLWLFADIPLLFWLERQRARVPRLRRRYLVPLWLLMVGTLSVACPVQEPVVTLYRLYQPHLILSFGILHYHAGDVVRSVTAALTPKETLTAADQRALLTRASGDGRKPNRYSGRFKGKNVVVMQVESLSQFVVGREIGGVPITPHLNRLVAESVYFPNVYHQVGMGHTSDAEFLTQVGLFGKDQGIAMWDLQDHRLYALPEAMRACGYATISMHAFSAQYYNRHRFHPVLGFQKSFFDADFSKNRIVGWGIDDQTFLTEAARKLRSEEQPFYSLLITLTSHHPYNDNYPAEHPLPLGPLANTMLGRYLAATHFTDEALGRFRAEMERNGLWKDTVLVLYGDHNALPIEELPTLARMLGERGDEVDWFRSQRVPLVIRLPGERGRVMAGLGGQVDVAPTLANLLGVEVPDFHWVGHDLLASAAPYVAFRDGSWIDAEHLYVNRKEQGQVQAFDLASHQPIPSERVTGKTGAVLQQLALSDSILKYDLMRELAFYPKGSRLSVSQQQRQGGRRISAP